MHAVIRTGGKQYRVKQGDIFNVEKLDAEVGSEITFGDILAIGEGETLRIGTPIVEGATVTARIIKTDRLKKVIVFKFKRRKNYKRKRGHRQHFTRIEITQIAG